MSEKHQAARDAVAQRKYAAAKPANAAPAITFNNASTTTPYTGPAWPTVRANAGQRSLNGRGV